MSDDYMTVEESAQCSGLHPNTLRRLLRQRQIVGYKMTVDGKVRWRVSASSLRQYTDPVSGFLLELPGPKLFLTRRDQDDGDD